MSDKPLAFDVSISRIPAGGKHFRIEPTEAERRAIAEALGIPEVPELTAELHVRPMGAKAFAVAGTLKGVVVQVDVVTLDPVRQEVSEAIDLTLEPASESAGTEDGPVPDERDVYRGGKIELGAIVVEHLALGLDPYPRAPGTEFPGHIEAKPDLESSPFAALAKLKRDPG